MPIRQHAPLILASGSSIRQQMLKAVGLAFSVVPSGVEEEAIKAAMAQAPLPELAAALARAKTLAVSAAHPDAYTIGADQICVHAGEVLSKPGSYARAEAQLARLAGSTHTQHCAMTLARGDEILWEFHDTATLTLRPLTAAEIRAYVAADAPLQSCGAYKFEGLGRHLFAQVEGDHDVIQGLALVPLLAQLHARGILSLA
ncbi:MAG: nucleoside triphosphate pyrophosphatase [Alphaproteobacteria bacterium]|nr:nucleoside triphosphate pyrophosphatase [Alphaproteobacteria bacterium]